MFIIQTFFCSFQIVFCLLIILWSFKPLHLFYFCAGGAIPAAAIAGKLDLDQFFMCVDVLICSFSVCLFLSFSN